MLGVTIIRNRRLDARFKRALSGAHDLALEAARVGDAEKIRAILLKDEETRRVIARVGRSAAKDYFEELREQDREKFEGTPEFQQWARDQREKALAKSQAPKDAPPVSTGVPVATMMLRYGILGMLIEHGMQHMEVIIKVFPEAPADAIKTAVGVLVSEGLVEISNGYYSAVDWTARLASLGIPQAANGSGNAHPDPQ